MRRVLDADESVLRIRLYHTHYPSSTKFIKEILYCDS